jgi:hypothetical protein
MHTMIRQLALLLLLPMACATPGTGAPTYNIRTTYILTPADGHPSHKPLSLDASDTRLQAATRSLTEVAGHPIVFQIDAALLPSLLPSTEDAIIQAVENTTSDLGFLRDKRPAVFALTASRLQRIECSYDATAAFSSYDLDDQQPVLRARLRPDTRNLVPIGEVRASLDAAWWRHLGRIYANRFPEDVPVAEHTTYFDYVSSSRMGFQPSSKGSPNDGHNPSAPIDPIIQVTRLFPLSRDPALRARMSEWLIGAGDRLMDTAARRPEGAESLPSSSPARQVQKIWVDWLKSNLESIDERQYGSLSRILFHKHHRERFGHQTIYTTIPELDPLEFGIDLMQDWVKATNSGNTFSARAKLAKELLCPIRIPHHDCSDEFYSFALNQPDGRMRLAKALIANHQDGLTEAVMAFIGHEAADEDSLAFARSLEPNERQWGVALRTMASQRDFSHPELFIDELARLWRAYPSPTRRGAVLFLLSQLERVRPDVFDPRILPPTKLAERFGSRISEAEYGAFIDHDPRAMASQRQVWRMLSPGWSIVGALVPRLDNWLGRQTTGLAEQHDRLAALRTVTEHVCKVSNAKELQQLHDYFQTRFQSHPGELGLEELVSALASPQCRRRGDRRVKQGNNRDSEAIPLFGD